MIGFRGRSRVAVFLLAALVATSCGRSEGASSSSGEPVGQIRVAAAASLTGTFQAIGESFKAANPRTNVVFDFGPSSGLADGLIEGSPADVFASADTKNMDKLIAAKLVAAGAAKVFALNQLEIAVPADNPGQVTGLGDFAESDLLIGLCAAEVPCGKLARQVLDKADIEPGIDTNEVDVKALLSKVEAGELDAGLVYRTDVQAAGSRVAGIAVSDEFNVVATYPAAVLRDAGNSVLASAFVEYLGTAVAQQILKDAGFQTP